MEIPSVIDCTIVRIYQNLFLKIKILQMMYVIGINVYSYNLFELFKIDFLRLSISSFLQPLLLRLFCIIVFLQNEFLDSGSCAVKLVAYANNYPIAVFHLSDYVAILSFTGFLHIVEFLRHH